jgi:hypothetical protein
MIFNKPGTPFVELEIRPSTSIGCSNNKFPAGFGFANSKSPMDLKKNTVFFGLFPPTIH